MLQAEPALGFILNQLAGELMQAVGQQLQAFAHEVRSALAAAPRPQAMPAPVNDTAARKRPGGVYQEPIGRPDFKPRRGKRGRDHGAYAREAVAGDQQGVQLAGMIDSGNRDTSMAAQIVNHAGSAEEIAAALRSGAMARADSGESEGLRAEIARLQHLVAQQAAQQTALANPAPAVQHAPVQVPSQPVPQWQPPQVPQWGPPPGWAGPRYPMQQYVAPQQPWGGFPPRR